MPPRNFPINWVVILLVVILFVVSSSFFLKTLSKTNNSSSTPLVRSVPSIISDRSDNIVPTNTNIGASHKVIYQSPNDSEGRTIIYDNPEYTGTNKFRTDFSGVGFISNKPFPYTVGLIQKIENIPNSKDKYITLNNPISDAQIGKLRLIYDNSKDSSIRLTSFGVEDMSSPGRIDERKTIFLNTLSDQQLNTLIKPQDAVVIILLSKELNTNYTVATDENGINIVWWLIIRRNNGNMGVTF